MLNEMPELRAPENSRTGIEIKPNVRYPDQTEAAIVSLRKCPLRKLVCAVPEPYCHVSLNYIPSFDAKKVASVTQNKSTTECGKMGTGPRAGVYKVVSFEAH